MRLAILGLLILAVAFAPVARAQDTAAARHEKGVMVPMRDGVRLATDLYLPVAPGKYPVVLTRSPYGRAGFAGLAETLARSGYAAVWQDVRGRFDSEGEWTPFVHEADDGYDTIEWAARQPWSDGRVVMQGGSYVAMVQWLAAKRKSPHLKGLVTLVSPGDFYENFMWEGGAFAFGAGAMWATFVDGKTNNDLAHLPWDSAFRKLPPLEVIKAVGHHPSYLSDWLGHPTRDAYWQALRWQDDVPAFDFPVLHVGGWFDIFQRGTIDNFRNMTARARPAARARQNLIVGPWGHTTAEQTRTGDVDFGRESTLGYSAILLRWLDRTVKGRTDQPAMAPVRVFMMGENQWRDYPTWPAPGTRFVPYFLRGKGRANGSGGDGALGTERPAAGETADRFSYDPANPVPTKGGGNCCWPDLVPTGPMDQRAVETRPDVLVYSTAPLDQPVRVLGPVELKLWIASSAPNTDFTGKLVDVAPDGYAMNLTDGIERASHRLSDRRPTLLEPGRPTEVTVDLWNTGHVFREGHRIRLEVSSSNYPRYARNLNTREQPEAGSAFVSADQTVFHDAVRASRLVLPVLPER